MRLVLDTNTVISGLLWQGTLGRLIDAAQKKSITLCTSVSLLAELRGVLAREKFAGQLQARALNISEVFDGYAALAVIVAPADIASIIAGDPANNAVLACALAAQADLIISGDPHLRNLKIYQGIPIITATDALRQIERARTARRKDNFFTGRNRCETAP